MPHPMMSLHCLTVASNHNLFYLHSWHVGLSYDVISAMQELLIPYYYYCILKSAISMPWHIDAKYTGVLVYIIQRPS